MGFVKLGRSDGTIEGLKKRYKTVYPNYELVTFHVSDSRAAETALFEVLQDHRIGRTETFTCDKEEALRACGEIRRLYELHGAAERVITITKYIGEDDFCVTKEDTQERVMTRSESQRQIVQRIFDIVDRQNQAAASGSGSHPLSQVGKPSGGWFKRMFMAMKIK